ncbi:hypothetical protein GCM10010302_44040 [Streptomyces polychromogenes]|uniref:Uncharacterized protein n=1 Tax=Streptomyces polychromogenes TaxID=67342 RepID=A0ABP3F8A3_9ACTN
MSIATQVTAYAAAADPADCVCWRQVARPPAPKVKRACSSVARSVDAAVIRALASTQGIREPRAATAKLEARPTPPPKSTKRANAARVPVADCFRFSAAASMTPPL